MRFTKESKQRLNLIAQENLARALPIWSTMNSGLVSLRVGFVLLAILFLWPATAGAQGGSISGSVLLPSGAPLNERARVILQTDRGIKSNVYTDNRGRFEFSRLPPSIYEVVIEADGDRFEVASVTVEVFANAPALVNVNLKEKKATNSTKAGTVISTGELDTAIPAAAKKEFERATEASKAGKIDEAIVHFRKALALYPQYVMARNDLGAQLLSQGKLDEAAEEFRHAIQLDPKAFNPRLNLGIVLVQQLRFSEAAAMLKTALALDPNAPAARLYDGLALKGSNSPNEAAQELKLAHDLGGPTYSVALFHLGQVYMNKGQRDLARQTLQSFLREAPNDPNAPQAKKLLEALR